MDLIPRDWAASKVTAPAAPKVACRNKSTIWVQEKDEID
jgi:hypothetical protein